MIKFNKPELLNGTQLLQELNAIGLTITSSPMVDENNEPSNVFLVTFSNIGILN